MYFIVGYLFYSSCPESNSFEHFVVNISAAEKKKTFMLASLYKNVKIAYLLFLFLLSKYNMCLTFCCQHSRKSVAEEKNLSFICKI